MRYGWRTPMFWAAVAVLDWCCPDCGHDVGYHNYGCDQCACGAWGDDLVDRAPRWRHAAQWVGDRLLDLFGDAV